MERRDIIIDGEWKRIGDGKIGDNGERARILTGEELGNCIAGLRRSMELDPELPDQEKEEMMRVFSSLKERWEGSSVVAAEDVRNFLQGLAISLWGVNPEVPKNDPSLRALLSFAVSLGLSLPDLKISLLPPQSLRHEEGESLDWNKKIREIMEKFWRETRVEYGDNNREVNSSIFRLARRWGFCATWEGLTKPPNLNLEKEREFYVDDEELARKGLMGAIEEHVKHYWYKEELEGLEVLFRIAKEIGFSPQEIDLIREKVRSWQKKGKEKASSHMSYG